MTLLICIVCFSTFWRSFVLFMFIYVLYVILFSFCSYITNEVNDSVHEMIFFIACHSWIFNQKARRLKLNIRNDHPLFRFSYIHILLMDHILYRKRSNISLFDIIEMHPFCIVISEYAWWISGLKINISFGLTLRTNLKLILLSLAERRFWNSGREEQSIAYCFV